MKRFIFLILAVCLSVLFTLSGCSCTGDTILEFNSSNIKDIKKDSNITVKLYDGTIYAKVLEIKEK